MPTTPPANKKTVVNKRKGVLTIVLQALPTAVKMTVKPSERVVMRVARVGAAGVVPISRYKINTSYIKRRYNLNTSTRIPTLAARLRGKVPKKRLPKERRELKKKSTTAGTSDTLNHPLPWFKDCIEKPHKCAEHRKREKEKTDIRNRISRLKTLHQIIEHRSHDNTSSGTPIREKKPKDEETAQKTNR